MAHGLWFRNPVLADVMAQLDYMEKRGSGLKRICNETKELETYKEGRDPVLKSSISQFMTIIYSMEFEPVDTSERTSKDTSRIQVVTNLGPSRITASEDVKTCLFIRTTNSNEYCIFEVFSLIRQLKKNNMIEHRGSAKTGGYYAKKKE